MNGFVKKNLKVSNSLNFHCPKLNVCGPFVKCETTTWEWMNFVCIYPSGPQ